MEEDHDALNALNESLEFIEECADAVYSPRGEKVPNGWATLHIDMTLMDEVNRQKIYQAERLLKEAGVGFDSSSGEGYRDWELDWSLSGAVTRVRPLSCLTQHKEPKRITDKIYWVAYLLSTDRVCIYPYCSIICRDEDKVRLEHRGWKIIYEWIMDNGKERTDA